MAASTSSLAARRAGRSPATMPVRRGQRDKEPGLLPPAASITKMAGSAARQAADVLRDLHVPGVDEEQPFGGGGWGFESTTRVKGDSDDDRIGARLENR